MCSAKLRMSSANKIRMVLSVALNCQYSVKEWR
jgi:hypothetical protein